MKPSLASLEFDRLLQGIAARAGSRAGADAVRSLEPGWSREDALRLRRETEEASGLLDRGVRLEAASADVIRDICSVLFESAAVLDPGQLRATAESLERLISFRRSCGTRDDEDRNPLPGLDGYLDRIPMLSGLVEHLLAITTHDGCLAEDASREHARLAKIVEELRRRLSERIERTAITLRDRGLLRDQPPTLRDGRYVLPVVSSKKRDVRGIVHDRSESGETVFVEPAGLVEEGNALREAVLDLEQEKRRILRDASSKVRGHLEEILGAAEAAALLDAIFARALNHLESGTVFPDEGPFSLIEMGHPLIPSNEMVRNTVRLPDDWRVLVVSGPNAGGKSVLLKAVGLAVACSQSGIGACAAHGSTLPFFSRLRVSIGDRQSIAEHRSTYSARLLEQLEMLRCPGNGTLALIDEPAAGTDPLTGASLAAAVLEVLAESGCRVIVTTHQGQLKGISRGRRGFCSGCMNFREDTLEPDYTYLHGLPGSSFTLEIAGRMGFPESIVERAQELSGDNFRLDRMLEELAGERNRLDSMLEDADRRRMEYEREIRAGREELKKASERLACERESMEKRLLDLERSINSRADSLLARLARSDSALERRELRERIREISIGSGFEAPLEAGIDIEPDREDIETGDWVSVRGWSGTGRVLDVGKDHASVSLGDIRLRKPLEDLARVPPPTCESSVSAGWSVPVEADSRLDLRGMSSDEALAELDRAVEDCLAAGIPYIKVIHGKGRGILMRAVVEMVRGDGRIASFRQGEPAEGGTGVTVLSLGADGRRR